MTISERRIANLEQTVTEVLPAVNTRFDVLERKVDGLALDVQTLHGKVDDLESKVGALSRKADSLGSSMGELRQDVRRILSMLP